MMIIRIRSAGIAVVVALALCGQLSYGQNDTLRFAFITDMHFGQTTQSGEQLYPALWLRKALDGVERKKPDFIFLGGDLITSSNSAEQYAMFDSVMVTAIPWYPMPGNHDLSEGASATLDKITTWISRGYGRGTNTREYYGFVKKNVGAFFVLNTQAYGSTVPSVLARADSQLVEMDNFFTANASVLNKFVCSHVPLFINAANEDSTGYFSIGPTYRKRIIALMNKHNARYYLAGHRHENDVKTDGNITVYTNTALSFQLGSGNQRGYYIYTVTANSVRRDFYPLSLEPDVVRWKWIAYGDTRTNDVAHRSVLQSIATNTPDYKFLFNVGDIVEDGSSNVGLWEIWKAACDAYLGGTGQTSAPPKYMSAVGNHEKFESGGIVNWRKYLFGQVGQFGNDGMYFTFDHEDARFILLDSEIDADPVQQQFLLNALQNNPRKWLFAIWHKPIFDFGPKVYEGGIHQHWGVPLYQNGCDIFFTGHAHYYTRSKKLNLNGQMNPPLDPVNGTVQVVTGDGGAPPYELEQNHDGNGYMVAWPLTKLTSPFYGYTELTIDGDTLHLRHFSASGTVMDEEVYHPNHKYNVGVHYRLTTQSVGSGVVLKSPSDTSYLIGTKVIITAEPELGWKFDGWTGDLKGTSNPDTVVMDANKNISAAFSQLPAGQYEVRRKIVGSGVVVVEPAGPYYGSGTIVTLRARPAWDSKLDAWSGDVSGTDTVVTVTMNAHKSVTATFRRLKTCGLRVRPALHGSVTLEPSGGEYVEGSQVTLRAWAESGWEFHEWTGDVNGTVNSQVVTVDQEKEIKAIFRKVGGGVQLIPASHDSYVQGSFSASRNFNADSTLRVREGSSDLNRCRAFVRFDAGGVTGQVVGAFLKMRVRNNGLPDGKGIKAAVYPVSSDTWLETTLNWNGAPVSGALIDSSTVGVEGLEYSWDISSFVTAELAGDKKVSLMLRDFAAMDKRIDFERREDGNGPTLVILTSTATEVEANEGVPNEYALHQNYPNPFNPETTIGFDLPKEGWTSLKAYDMLGKEVATLVEQHLPPGFHRVRWNAAAMPSGAYVCRLETLTFSAAIKVLLMK
jgi:uncharacterized repeat protein (TIGR02543 family)